MSDIIRITLLNSNYQKFFEADAPADKPNKVRDLILLAKSKGVNIGPTSKRSEEFEWW